VADFSSRGPSGSWYKEHPEDWERDRRKYGENLLKPDCVAPGGGPVGNRKPVDLLYSGTTGWFDGFYDFLLDGYEGMRGTSMATPHAAGLIALAVDRGLVKNANEIKQKFKTQGVKDIHKGYGFLKWGWFKK